MTTTQYYWPDYIKDLNAAIKAGDTIFDAGAGDGHWEKNIEKEVNYISMDLGVGDKNVDYSHLTYKGDLAAIPIPDSTVDVVICIQVLEHVTQPWMVITEFFRILKPGGKLFLTCPQGVPLHQEPHDYYRYTNHGIRFLFEQSGLQIVSLLPQKGNINKMTTDLRIFSQELNLKNKKIKALLVKVIAKFLDFVFSFEDMNYFSNTTGYFVQATKP